MKNTIINLMIAVATITILLLKKELIILFIIWGFYYIISQLPNPWERLHK